MKNPVLILLWIVIAVAIYAWLRKDSPANRLKAEMRRPASFSLVIFRGDVSKAIPRLLQTCEYKILESTGVKKSLLQLYADLATPTGPKNTIVSKAYCVIGGFTILYDPEMVFLTYIDELTGFCREHLTQSFVAVWERVS